MGRDRASPGERRADKLADPPIASGTVPQSDLRRPRRCAGPGPGSAARRPSCGAGVRAIVPVSAIATVQPVITPSSRRAARRQRIVGDQFDLRWAPALGSPAGSRGGWRRGARRALIASRRSRGRTRCDLGLVVADALAEHARPARSRARSSVAAVVARDPAGRGVSVRSRAARAQDLVPGAAHSLLLGSVLARSSAGPPASGRACASRRRMVAAGGGSCPDLTNGRWQDPGEPLRDAHPAGTPEHPGHGPHRQPLAGFAGRIDCLLA